MAWQKHDLNISIFSFIWVSHITPPTANRVWCVCKYVRWLLDLTLQAYSACLSDCTLDVHTRAGALLHYDFSPLANVTGFHSSPRFTNKGLKYFHRFNVGLCGKEVRRQWSWWFGFFCMWNSILTYILTWRVSLTGPHASDLCGQCNGEWEGGQRLRMPVHCGSLWNQESEHGVLPALPHRWLTHR